MSTPATPPPASEPSNRLPWIALGGGGLILVVAIIIFLLLHRGPSNVNLTVNSGPTSTAEAIFLATATANAAPPATFTPVPTPTPLPATATPLPSPTPILTATPLPVPTVPPSPTSIPTSPPAAAVPPLVLPTLPPTSTPITEPIVGAAPTAPAPAAAAAPPIAAAPPPAAPTAPPAATASPTPFAGQPSSSGGLGNTQADVQGAYGAPTGQNSSNLVAYTKGSTDYRVEFSQPSSRADVEAVLLPPQGTVPVTTAEQQTRPLFPLDAQPTDSGPQGNPQYTLERFTSPMLAQIFPASLFQSGDGQPGSFIAVYLMAGQGDQVSRIIVGAGDNADTLIAKTGD